MTARKYRKPGRPPGRTGKGGTRPRTAKGGGRRARSGCLTLIAALAFAFGASFIAAGLTPDRAEPTPAPVTVIRPATESERLHHWLTRLRECKQLPEACPTEVAP